MARFESGDMRKAREWLLQKFKDEGILHDQDFTTGSFAPPRKVLLERALDSSIAQHAHAGSVLQHSTEDTVLLNMLKRVKPELTREVLAAHLDHCVSTSLGVDTQAITEQWAVLLKDEKAQMAAALEKAAAKKAGKTKANNTAKGL